MDRNQTPKENYEYTIPKEDIDGIKKAATAGLKKLMIVASAVFVLLFVFAILAQTHTVACMFLTAGILIVLLLATSVKNTCRSFDKSKSSTDTVTYKLRIYDDFLVCEKSRDEGIALLSTASLYQTAILGENERYTVISTGVYAIPVPKDILNGNSFLLFLRSLKGAKPKAPANAPEFFYEPRDIRPQSEPTPIPCEEIPCPFSEATVQIHENSEPDATECPQEYQESFTSSDVSSGADSFKSGSFEAYDSAKANETSSPYLYESVLSEDKNKKLKLAGTVTFVLSLVAIFAALAATVVSVILESSPLIPLLTISLLPVSSLIVGFMLWKRKENWGKNILAAALALIVIISIDPSDAYVYDDNTDAEGRAYLESVEQTLDVELPEATTVYYYSTDSDNFTELSAELGIEACNSFVEYTKSNAKFVSKYPNTHMGILPEYYRDNDSTVALVYNLTTNEYNTLPQEAGTYRMIYISVYTYDDNSANIRIYEYNLEYVTEFN